MRKLYFLLVCVTSFICTVTHAQPVSLTLNTTYSQDFNTLANTSPGAFLPAGWLFSETGTGANTSYTAADGSGNGGDTYSFGTATATERAFGGLLSGSVTPTIGAAFTNNTGTTVTSLTVSYTGEQWRLGATGRVDRLDFQYSLNATSLTSGTWTDVNNLDFTAPVTAGSIGALDGNVAPNRASVSFTITGLSIASGATFYIRWNDFNPSGSDDGLGIDDFSITPGVATSTQVSVAGTTDAAEPATNGSFTVSLSSSYTSDITVSYNFTGTATLGVDYADPNNGSIVIPAGSTSVAIPVNVINDALAEASETITINLTGATSPYTISAATASINLTSEDIGTISFTGSYSQDFNTLGATGTPDFSTLPNGWLFTETGINSNTSYAASDGSSNSGNSYSFGTGTASDRAMGLQRSGSLIPVMGAFFTNNTGAPVTSLTITYTGEQWRLGTSGRSDRMDFQFSTSATSLANGTWTDADGLDFIAPNSSGTVGAFDGNASGNRTTITYTINGLNIPDNSTFAIRWSDYDVTGAEDGLGVDDFTITLGCTPPTNQPATLNLTPSLQSISGSFTAAAAGTTPADNYLVLMSTSASLTDMPATGTVYAIDDEVGNAKVVSISGTSFNTTGLTPSTTYYFYVFSTGGTTCYNVISPLTDNTTTTTPPACTPPITQATNLAAANITGASMDLSWTRGSGDNILVIARTGAPVDAVIYNSVAYPAGATIGTGNTVIYNGPAASFTYSPLSQNTTYHLALYEYNSADNCYLSPALTGNFTTLCTNPVNVSALSGTAGNQQAIVSWTLPASACFDEIIVVASNAPIANNGDTYTGPANTAYTGGEQIVYRGTGTTVTITGLTNGSTYYLKAFTRKGANYSAGIQITIIPYDPASGYVYMYGNLHAHSSYSDGNKDDISKKPIDDYTFARDALCMDFLGISEHNHAGAGMSRPNYALGYADANTVNGTSGASGNPFVSLWGMEWGTISGGGHVLVYGFDDQLLGWETNNYDIYVEKSNYASLWNTVNNRSGAFATLAHPNNSDYSSLVSGYNATADAAIVGQAIESGPAFSTSTTYNDFPSSLSYLSYYRNMLSKGYHVAPQMDQDNHNMTFGTANSNRMVVLSSTRTREGLMEAIRSMRFYASNDCNLQLDFQNNNKPMGSQAVNAGVPHLMLNITDPDLESTLSIELWGGEVGAAVPGAALKTGSGNSLSFTAGDANNIQSDNTTWYYYAVVTQEDGNKAVTAPIWYTRNDAILPVTLISFKGEYDRPANKVYLTWSTAQESNNREFIVERSSDGRTYTAIGKVAAAGNNNHPVAYNYTDKQPVYGVNYYRLKQVDVDEKATLSGIVKIITDKPGGFIAGPNPAHSSVTVYRQNNTEPVRIELMDVNGKIIKQLSMAATTASTPINVRGLSKGIYLLQLTTSKGKQTEKIMVE
jgi:trimeric autotransporter adhesin